jgi:hypothetical protein
MLPVRGLESNNSSVVKEFRNLTRVKYRCYYDAIGFVTEKDEALAMQNLQLIPLLSRRRNSRFSVFWRRNIIDIRGGMGLCHYNRG